MTHQRKKKALDLLRRGMSPRQVAARLRYTVQHVRRIRAELPEAEQEASREAGRRAMAKAVGKRRRESGSRQRIKDYFADTGATAAEAAEALGYSPQWCRAVLEQEYGSVRTRARRVAEHRALALKRSQEARDLRKGSIEPHYWHLLHAARTLLPASAWDALLEGEAVSVTLRHPRIDALDSETVMVLPDECLPYVQLGMDACALWEDDETKQKTGPATHGISRWWRQLIYEHGEWAQFKDYRQAREDDGQEDDVA